MTVDEYRLLQTDKNGAVQKPKDPRRQRQGKVNRDVGEQFETLISHACDYYRNAKIADVTKTPEPMRVIRPLGEGQYVACFDKKAQPDYKGTLKGGRSVIFEAKHTTMDKMEQTRVTPKQTAMLDRYDELGAECFVIIGFGMKKFFRIPWEIWSNMQAAFRRKFIMAEELIDYKIDIGKNGVLMFLR